MNPDRTGSTIVTDTSPVIALIGGSGFIGKYIARALAREGYRLKIICRNPNAANAIKTTADLGQILLVKGDLAKPETCAAHLRGVSAVVNLVGIMGESGKQNFINLHAKGAERLAQIAASEGIAQFIQFSALSVDKATASTYARSKLLGEKAVLSAFPAATILRPSVVFGAEDQFYNRFASMAALSPVLPLIGGGKTKFQPVYVDDLAKAVVACIKSPAATAGKIYELAGPETYTFKQILEYIGKTIGRERDFVTLPFSLAEMMGAARDLLPYNLPLPKMTRDQIRLLKYDNVASGQLPGFAELGIRPEAPEMVVPSYLRRFHKLPIPQPQV